jgi:hypothetical protein
VIAPRNIFLQHVVFQAWQAPGTPQQTFLCAFALEIRRNLFIYIQLRQKPFGTNLHELAPICTNRHQLARIGPFRHALARIGPMWAVPTEKRTLLCEFAHRGVFPRKNFGKLRPKPTYPQREISNRPFPSIVGIIGQITFFIYFGNSASPGQSVLPIQPV